VPALPRGGKRLDLWYPVISDDGRQQVLDVAFDPELPLTAGYDPEHGNRLIHVAIERPLPAGLEFAVSYTVETAAGPDGGRALAEAAATGLEAARHLLGAGPGATDARAATRTLLRRCREAGLEARQVAGHRAASTAANTRLLPHLWIELFVPSCGWLPLDPTAEGAEPGNLAPDRVARARGDHLLLHPVQRGPRIPALFGPYAEVDGTPHAAEVEARAHRADAAAAAGQLTADVALDASADLGVELPAGDPVGEMLASLVPAPRRIRLAAGATYYQTDPGDEWLLLLTQGSVRLSRFTLGGKKLELDVLQAPAFFVGARLGKGVAEALADTEMRVLSRAEAGELVRRRPDLGFRLVESMGARLVDNEDRLEYLAYHGVPERVALALLRLRRRDDGLIEGITHQELGDIVGSYRETVTKVLGGFQAAGYIELGHRRIKVANPAGLAELLEA